MIILLAKNSINRVGFQLVDTQIFMSFNEDKVFADKLFSVSLKDFKEDWIRKFIEWNRFVENARKE